MGQFFPFSGVQHIFAFVGAETKFSFFLCHIKKTINIPVIMKLGDNLTNPVALIDQLYANGAAAVVLFNRFYTTGSCIINLVYYRRCNADPTKRVGEVGSKIFGERNY